MTKNDLKLWCVKKGGAVVVAPGNIKYWGDKESAKEARNDLHGELPENPDRASEWKYHVSPGPDHWRVRYA